jgi:hypothetical protein
MKPERGGDFPLFVQILEVIWLLGIAEAGTLNRSLFVRCHQEVYRFFTVLAPFLKAVTFRGHRSLVTDSVHSELPAGHLKPLKAT